MSKNIIEEACKGKPYIVMAYYGYENWVPWSCHETADEALSEAKYFSADRWEIVKLVSFEEAEDE